MNGINWRPVNKVDALSKMLSVAAVSDVGKLSAPAELQISLCFANSLAGKTFWEVEQEGVGLPHPELH